MSAWLTTMKAWAKAAKREAITINLAARDPRIPRHVRVLALLVAAYVLSPIDLIPDFIPVLGMLDEVILLPAAVWLIARQIDPALLAEHREHASRLAERPQSTLGAVLIVGLWVLVAGALAWWWFG